MDNLKIEELPQEWQEKRTPCEIWNRVMGYFRPYQTFNKGKQSEFDERKYFNSNEID